MVGTCTQHNPPWCPRAQTHTRIHSSLTLPPSLPPPPPSSPSPFLTLLAHSLHLHAQHSPNSSFTRTSGEMWSVKNQGRPPAPTHVHHMGANKSFPPPTGWQHYAIRSLLAHERKWSIRTKPRPKTPHADLYLQPRSHLLHPPPPPRG